MAVLVCGSYGKMEKAGISRGWRCTGAPRRIPRPAEVRRSFGM